MNRKKETMSVSQLPIHTRINVIVGMALDLKLDGNKWFQKTTRLSDAKKYGYMVEGLINPVKIDGMGYSQIYNEIENLFKKIKDKQDLFIVGWNTPSGKTIELSEWFPCIQLAIDAARVRGLSEIYDIVNGESKLLNDE